MATKARKSPGGTGGSKVAVRDSFENVLSGLGGDKDKLVHQVFVVREMSRQQQDAAYRGDWIARKVVDIPADDSTREWRGWQADKADIGKIEDLEDSLKLQQKVKTGRAMARLYGGAALIIGADQGAMDQELRVDKLGKDSLKFVHVVSRHDLNATGPMIWDLQSPWYGMPEFYTRTRGNMERLHPSRVVRLLGNTAFDEVVLNTGWADSSLQVVQDATAAVGLVFGSTAQTIAEMRVDIVKIPQLIKLAGNAEYEQRLKDRFALAQSAKGVFSTYVMDKEEEWERISQSFVGLPDMMKMYLLVASAAVDIPATRFLSQSPAGLSATGESDIRNHYDRIKADQNNVLRPALEVLDEIILRSALGKFDEDIFYEWNSLWQMDDEQKGKVDKSKADTHKIDVDAGIIPPEILRDARINQLIEDGVYPGLEQIVEDFGPLEDIEEELVDPVTGQPIDPNAPPAAAPKGPQEQAGEPAPKPKQKGPPRPADALVDRVRAADLQPRTLYVRRDVVNKRALAEWATSQGLTLVDDPHVTLLYSRKPVDWNKAGEAWGQDEAGRIRVRPGGMRVVEKLGANAIALCFASSELCYRHHDLLRSLDTTWDYDSFQPHVTIEKREDKEPLDLTKIEPFTGELVFGPEVFEETK